MKLNLNGPAENRHSVLNRAPNAGIGPKDFLGTASERICCVMAKMVCNGEIINAAKTHPRVLLLRTHIVCPGAGHVKCRK